MLGTNIKIGDFNWSLLDQGMVSASNFISTILLARILNLDDFGAFSTLWLAILFVNSLHVAIIIFPMMSIAPRKTRPLGYFSGLHRLQLLFTVTTSAIVLLFILLHRQIYGELLPQSVAFGLILVLASYHMQDFYRKHLLVLRKYFLAFATDTIVYFLRVIILLVILALQIDISLAEVFYIFAITFSLGAVFGVLFYKSKYIPEESGLVISEHWKMSKWLLPSGILQWTSVNWYLVAASVLLGPASVGIIRLVQNIVGALNVVLLSLENYLPTKFSYILAQNGTAALWAYYKKTTIIGVFAVSFVGLLLAAFAKPIMHILYGPAFVQYSYLIIWYAPIFVLMFLIVPIRGMLRTLNATKIWFNSYIVTSVFTLLAFYPLEAYLGINGVMAGILLSHILLIFAAIYGLSKKEKL